MARWVKCSDRLPTKSDADSDGNVFVMYPDDSWCLVKCYNPVTPGKRRTTRLHLHRLANRNDLFWLENVPQPRTLEDVVREFFRCSERGGVSGSDWCNDLIKEMREILEKGQNDE